MGFETTSIRILHSNRTNSTAILDILYEFGNRRTDLAVLGLGNRRRTAY